MTSFHKTFEECQKAMTLLFVSSKILNALDKRIPEIMFTDWGDEWLYLENPKFVGHPTTTMTASKDGFTVIVHFCRD